MTSTMRRPKELVRYTPFRKVAAVAALNANMVNIGGL